MKILQATAADAPRVAALAAKMWTSHTAAELSEEFETLMADGQGAVFLCCADGKAIGFAQCQLRQDYVEGTETSPVGYLEGIFVEEAYRHRGCAKMLLAECEQWARARGCREFASDCELENSQSLAFHLQMGFREVNRIICFTKKL